MYQVPFERWLSRQFSIAYDLYLDIRCRVDSLVQAALQRDSPDWRLRNACPACTYKLKGERVLKFSMLFTMDGNDSLKRILRRGPSGEATEESTGPVIERPDPRTPKTDYYIPRDIVDKWAKDVPQEMISTQTTKVCLMKYIRSTLKKGYTTQDGNSDETSEPNPCALRWRNMSTDITKRMWGIFDETGIFLSLCRHGFTLVIADMVRSGEM